MGLRIDHVIWATRDLDDAAAWLLREHGLAAVPGGRHPGQGTANRIVPLGSAYLEILAVVDPEEARHPGFGRTLSDRLSEVGDGLFSWAVATDDIQAVADRMGLRVQEGSRVRPDGTALRWRSAGTPGDPNHPGRPFFIQWDGPPELHPGRMAAPQRIEPLGIEWVAVAGDLDTVLGSLPLDRLPLRIEGGPPGIVAVGVRAGESEIVIR